MGQVTRAYFGLGFKIQASEALLKQDESLHCLYELEEFIEAELPKCYDVFTVNNGYDTELTGIYIVFSNSFEALTHLQTNKLALITHITQLDLEIDGVFDIYGGLYTY